MAVKKQEGQEEMPFNKIQPKPKADKNPITYSKIFTKDLENKIIEDHGFSEEAANAIVLSIPKKELYELISKHIGNNYIEDGYNEVVDSFAFSQTSLDDVWHHHNEDNNSIVYRTT